MVPKAILITALFGTSQVQSSHTTDFDLAELFENFKDLELDFKGSDRTSLAPVKYDPDLKCGECVAGGHNFCWRATIPGEMIEDKNFPKTTPFKKSMLTNDDTESRCCYNEKDVALDHRNAFCDNIVWTKPDEKTSKQSEWICSNSYKDTTYGLHVCPFKRSACGPRSTLDFYKIEDDGAIHI